MSQNAASKESNLKTYIFQVDLEKEEDGRWSAVVQSLPGCATWGYSKQEALKALQEATQAYVQTLLEQGKQVPSSVDIEVKETPAVSVTV
jgi:predicted RNase H-like HicB family nuclease